MSDLDCDCDCGDCCDCDCDGGDGGCCHECGDLCCNAFNCMFCVSETTDECFSDCGRCCGGSSRPHQAPMTAVAVQQFHATPAGQGANGQQAGTPGKRNRANDAANQGPPLSYDSVVSPDGNEYGRGDAVVAQPFSKHSTPVQGQGYDDTITSQPGSINAASIYGPENAQNSTTTPQPRFVNSTSPQADTDDTRI